MYIKNKITTLLLLLFIICTLTACKTEHEETENVYSDINNDDIPDVLEKTVGTISNCYYTSGDLTDTNDYHAYLTATFQDTTAKDYEILMKHYQSSSEGTNEDGALLFDWGWLYVKQAENSITIEAFIIDNYMSL